jgi:conjugal transfer/type IV secretion protein DotA/TraY
MRVIALVLGVFAVGLPLSSLAAMPPEALAASSNSLSGLLVAMYAEPMQRFLSLMQGGFSGFLHPLVLSQMLGDQMLAMATFGKSVMVGAKVLPFDAAYLQSLRPLFTVVNGVLWAMGMLFSVVIPAVPMAFFFMAFLHWLVTVISAVSGVTLLSVRLAATGKANFAPLYRVLVDLIFRPSLTCMGFICAGAIVWAFSVPFYLLFSDALASFNSLGGLAGTLGGLLVFGRILLFVTTRAFSLCSGMPDLVIDFFERNVVKLA